MAYFPPEYIKQQQRKYGAGQDKINQSTKDRINAATGQSKPSAKPSAKTGGGLRSFLKTGAKLLGPTAAVGFGAYDTAKDVYDTGPEEYAKQLGNKYSTDGKLGPIGTFVAGQGELAQNIGNAATFGYAGELGKRISRKFSGGDFFDGAPPTQDPPAPGAEGGTLEQDAETLLDPRDSSVRGGNMPPLQSSDVQGDTSGQLPNQIPDSALNPQADFGVEQGVGVQDGVEVQPSVRGSQGGDVARTDFNQADTQITLGDDNASGLVTDSRGNTGAIGMEREAYDRLNPENKRGTFSTYSAEDVFNDPERKSLARQAAAGQISTAQYNAGLRDLRLADEAREKQAGSVRSQNVQSSRTASRIRALENALSKPGRGTNQSIGSMLTEARLRKNKRRQLDQLYGLQKNENSNQSAERRTEAQAQSAQADRQAREGIERQKAIQTSNKATRAESVRNEQEQYNRAFKERDFQTNRIDKENARVQANANATRTEKKAAMKEATATYRETAKATYPDDIDRQNMHVAKMQQSHVKPGDPYFATPEGREARATTAKTLYDYIDDEDGLIDFGREVLGLNRAPTQADIENMDFSGFNFDDAGSGALSLSSTIRATGEGKGGHYAYKGNMSPEFVEVMRNLIANDKLKKRRDSARAGQAQIKKNTAEFIRSQ